MCGISGQLRFDDQPVDRELVKKMTRCLSHRGPDGTGHYFSERIGLGHRRLAIIDLKDGQQPMLNQEHSLCLVSNNEIYNYRELKKELEPCGHRFKTSSDTEIILQLFAKEREQSFCKLEGMFAFALWDQQKEILYLVRDPFGIKPLYYYHDKAAFIFASELRALFNYRELNKELDLIAIDGYLRSLALPEPHSIFRKVHKLPAGYFLKVQRGKVQLKRYWEPAFSNDSLAFSGRAKSAQALIAEFRHRLENSVRLSLRSDVPVGVLLSGGVDSSAVTAIASHESAQPLHTFSVAFKEGEFNESEFSRIVARSFGTKHHEVLVTKRRATQIASRLVELLDEPFADSSSIPTYAVCEQASTYVKTVLSGEGADELLGGYPWHLVKSGRRDKNENDMAIREHPSRVIFTEEQRSSLYSKDWRRELQKQRARKRYLNESSNVSQLSILNQSLLEDIQTYLPSDILVKSDRMSMLHSLEIRVPFLNREFAGFAMRLPDKMKVNGTIRKYILKQSMKGILPDTILERSKKGFSIPMDLWLWEKGQWREMIYDTIFSQRTRARGQFDMKTLERLQSEHERLENLHGYKLWTIYMFESWQRAFID